MVSTSTTRVIIWVIAALALIGVVLVASCAAVRSIGAT